MGAEAEEGACEVHVEESISLPLHEEDLASAVARVLEMEGAGGTRISLAFLGDAEMARLNRDHLGHDGPTDVISFPLDVPGQPLFGDIYIGLEQARRQADSLAVPLEEELLRLVIHGILHVLGHDHPDGPEREASAMYARQEALLREVRGVN